MTGAPRRDFLKLAALSGGAAVAAACGPASAPAQPATAPAASAPAKAAWEEEWDRLVAAARDEKVLSLASYSGIGYRRIVEAFQQAFPGITVEHQQFESSSRDYVPRLLQELKAGLYTWD